MESTVSRYQPRPYSKETEARLHEQGVNGPMARILAARGVDNMSSLTYSLSKALPVATLTNANDMAARIADKMEKGERFVLVADYDSDGATACAIGVRAMRGFGANIDFKVPNRFVHGYGLTPEIVQEIVAEKDKTHCILTVDNGIASVAGIEEAAKHGISVLVTDHHLAGDVLPDAECIVNPNQPGCTFASKNLAGCGVIFYVMMALKRELNQRGWFKDRPNFEVMSLLDFVALGTVADVVKLDDNNRTLVSAGLQRMRDGKAHAGIAALLEVASREPEEVTSFDMGFGIGPRLNAAGRLDDMSVGIRCLLTDDPQEALQLAAQLDAYNRERRSIEMDMTDQAVADIENREFDPKNQYSMVLFHPDWHQGVIGILASRIKDKTHRPTIAFGRGTDGELKGSCRSIPALHMRDALDVVYKQNPGLIKKFGGHSMAAGLTIMEKDLPAFVVAFEEACRHMMSPGDLDLVIDTDGALETDDMTIQLARNIDRHIWGQGFPEPVFQGNFRVVKQQQVGKKQEHAKLILEQDGVQFDAIFFRQTTPLPEEVQAVYSLKVNEYKGIERVNLQLQKVQEMPSLDLKVNTGYSAGPDGLSL